MSALMADWCRRCDGYRMFRSVVHGDRSCWQCSDCKAFAVEGGRL